jgi:hypothetical protein
MPLAGFETAIPASERPQTHALDRLATGISGLIILAHEESKRSWGGGGISEQTVRAANCQNLLFVGAAH